MPTLLFTENGHVPDMEIMAVLLRSLGNSKVLEMSVHEWMG